MTRILIFTLLYSVSAHASYSGGLQHLFGYLADADYHRNFGSIVGNLGGGSVKFYADHAGDEKFRDYEPNFSGAILNQGIVERLKAVYDSNLAAPPAIIVNVQSLLVYCQISRKVYRLISSIVYQSISLNVYHPISWESVPFNARRHGPALTAM